jgi:hypothetical protein
MRLKFDDRLEQGRVRAGDFKTNPGWQHGAFLIMGPCGAQLKIISSVADDVYPWEHVSVSTKNRCPNWQEMCFVKKLFWKDDESVMQLHPSESMYVNNHPFCLHLWRPTKAEIPLPPPLLVGVKEVGEFKSRADAERAQVIADAQEARERLEASARPPKRCP